MTKIQENSFFFPQPTSRETLPPPRRGRSRGRSRGSGHGCGRGSGCGRGRGGSLWRLGGRARNLKNLIILSQLFCGIHLGNSAAAEFAAEEFHQEPRNLKILIILSQLFWQFRGRGIRGCEEFRGRLAMYLEQGSEI